MPYADMPKGLTETARPSHSNHHRTKHLSQAFTTMEPSNTAYEPMRHGCVGEPISEPYDPEKPLVPESQQHAKAERRLRNPNKTLKERTKANSLRLALRAVSLVLSISILAVQAHTLDVWFETRKDVSSTRVNGMTMQAWAYLDSKPTWVMFATSIFASVIHLFALGSLCAIVRCIVFNGYV
jgi:hypothetical protein